MREAVQRGALVAQQERTFEKSARRDCGPEPTVPDLGASCTAGAAAGVAALAVRNCSTGVWRGGREGGMKTELSLEGTAGGAPM